MPGVKERSGDGIGRAGLGLGLLFAVLVLVVMAAAAVVVTVLMLLLMIMMVKRRRRRGGVCSGGVMPFALMCNVAISLCFFGC